jgi:two-component system, NarL family, invasion response regulator UvrY
VIRVVLCDDHPLVREGLHRILSEDAGIRVVGEAADGESLLARLATTEADVVVLDVSMPGPGFLEVMNRIRAHFPSLRVLVVSIHSESLYADRALKAGAAGYVSKRQSVEELTRAIMRVSRGGVYVSRRTPSGSWVRPALPKETAVQQLSTREFEIFLLLAQGRGITQIASSLQLSPKTVSTYRLRLLQKLGLETNAALVRFAVENELIT